jgi:dTDP-4-dehydrorhamnose 3,5-epimerase-like enzyme
VVLRKGRYPPSAEETLALLFCILLYVFAQIGTVRPQSPHFGEIEHLGDDLQAAVGIVRYVTHVVVQLGDARVTSFTR